MALTIGDGTKTAVLDAPGIIGLARNGWAQSGPDEQPDGRFGDVEETLRLEWYETAVDSSRAALLQTIGQLAQRARTNAQRHLLRYIPPDQQVVLTANTPTETQPRYAIVRSVDVPKLDPRHRGSAGPVQMTLRLRREGLWRGIKPGDPPLQVLPTTNIPNAGANYVTIPPEAIPGDAPALTTIQVEPLGLPTSSYDLRITNDFYVMIARLTADTEAELDAFTPYIWASQQNAANAYTTVPLASYPYTLEAIPGGQILHVQRLDGTKVMEVDVDASGYLGTYQIYGIHHASDNGSGSGGAHPDLTASLGWADSAVRVVGGDIPMGVYSHPYWALTHVGTYQIPPGNFIVNPMGAFRFGCYVTAGGAEDVGLGGLMLIPAHEQTMSAHFGYDSLGRQPDTLVFDGEQRRTYGLRSGSLVETSTGHEGPYIELEPGKYNRLFVYHVGWRRTTNPAWLSQISWNVQVHIVPRYRYLRG